MYSPLWLWNELRVAVGVKCTTLTQNALNKDTDLWLRPINYKKKKKKKNTTSCLLIKRQAGFVAMTAFLLARIILTEQDFIKTELHAGGRKRVCKLVLGLTVCLQTPI